MALTLTEIMVIPVDNKRMAIYKITGDGTSYQITISDLKMSKVEAAWTENVSNETKLIVRIENYDYVDSYVTILELGDEGGPLENAKEHLLFVIGY